MRANCRIVWCCEYRVRNGTKSQRALVLVPSVFLCLFLLFQSSTALQMKQVRRVLIFYEAGAYKPLPNLVDQGMRTAFDNSPYRIEFYREFMETAQFPDPADQKHFRDFYVRKYQSHRPDIIIAVGPTPLQFMLEAHQKYFRGVPVIFCLPNRLPGGLNLDPDFTGIEGDVAPAATLDAALRLQPDTQHVVLVGGTSPFDREQEAEAKDQLKSYENRFDIFCLTDLTMPALLERLKSLPSHSIILLATFGRDAEGRVFSAAEANPMVVAAANAPVFSLNDRHLNDGEVGGDVADAVVEGKTVGATAVRILNGEKPQNIPTIKTANAYVFDLRALKHWGFKEKNLPPGSIVLNREPTVWEVYKWYLIAGISLILLQTALIAGLMWQRGRRRRAEGELTAALEVARESEARFRLVANTAPVMIWMSGPDKLCSYLNQPWLDFTGRPLVSELGSGWAEGVHPHDLQLCLNTYDQFFQRREPFKMQYRLRRHDGEYRWILDTGVPRFSSDGSFAGYIGSCLDMTERKQAEEALSSVSRRLIDAQEQERTRIARELHDDINQRIAMLGIELDVLQQSLPNQGAELQSRLDELRQQTAEIGTDVQGISHRLHSSKLEYLGLVAACKSFCREVAEWHKVDVNFVSENIAPTLSQEISLCLFRVLQESLNNAIKHSGAQRFEAQLRGTSNEIQLTVRDHGIGFDAAAVMVSRGLGFISMRERVSAVNGTILIGSKPMGGTEITVRVPVVARAASKTIVGAA
jgi:PAS domain S-box-containing protein